MGLCDLLEDSSFVLHQCVCVRVRGIYLCGQVFLTILIQYSLYTCFICDRAFVLCNQVCMCLCAWAEREWKNTTVVGRELVYDAWCCLSFCEISL